MVNLPYDKHCFMQIFKDNEIVYKYVKYLVPDPEPS